MNNKAFIDILTLDVILSTRQVSTNIDVILVFYLTVCLPPRPITIADAKIAKDYRDLIPRTRAREDQIPVLR